MKRLHVAIAAALFYCFLTMLAVYLHTGDASWLVNVAASAFAASVWVGLAATS